MFRSLFFFCSLFVLTVFFSLSAILAALLTPGGNLAHWVGRMWARSLLFAGGVRVQTEGLHRIDPHQSYVFAANHQSQFDIFVLLAHLPIQFRWLAKKELFRIPIFGLAMKGAGYISIDRSNRKQAFKSIDVAAARVREGTSIVIFPEGTRSLDGRLKGFKKGGFHLAIKAKRPIVPVSISGTFSILPKRGFKISPREARIYIGEPVPTEDLGVDDRHWLISEVRRRIQEHLSYEEKGDPEPQIPRPTVADSRSQ
jgi:1-acyl-sn-glycerol-3-phosphate acyltransferase